MQSDKVARGSDKGHKSQSPEYKKNDNYSHQEYQFQRTPELQKQRSQQPQEKKREEYQGRQVSQQNNFIRPLNRHQIGQIERDQDEIIFRDVKSKFSFV